MPIVELITIVFVIACMSQHTGAILGASGLLAVVVWLT